MDGIEHLFACDWTGAATARPAPEDLGWLDMLTPTQAAVVPWKRLRACGFILIECSEGMFLVCKAA